MILIDDRAGSCDLIHHPPLNKLGELCRLPAADVCISGNGPTGAVTVGVEVKTVPDLIASINTGRLQGTQLPGMLEHYDVVWLGVYGVYRPGNAGELQVQRGKSWRVWRLGKAGRAIPYSYVEGLLLDLAATGVGVKSVATIGELAVWLGVLGRWWGKAWAKHKGLHTFDNSRNVSLMPSMDAGTHLRARVAAQLPGVGFDRAVRVARYFKSVREMMCAGPEEWERVDGIGKVVARAVEEAVS